MIPQGWLRRGLIWLPFLWLALFFLLPLLVGRVLALGGWTLSPVVFLLVATGLAVEFLAWASGFGAVLTNTFSRWQARRATRSTPPTSAPTP